jgi:thioredoxin reductase (NADPH)
MVCVELDEKGFIKTGPGPDAARSHGCPVAARALALSLETSRPGVFAVGDVRCGNFKRVASAVGEGSIAVSFVRRALTE